MATPETLLSVNDGEKLEKLDANKEDGSVQEVGGPESDWSTANYANFKFDATAGVSPDSTILSDAAVDAEKAQPLKEEDELCPACGQSPCACDSVKEQDDMVDPEEKIDDVASPDVADEMAAAAEDDSLELDLSDLVDDEEEVVELNGPVDSVSDDEEDMLVTDEEDPMAADSADEFVPSDDEMSESDEVAALEVPMDDEQPEEMEEGGYGLMGGLRGPKREEMDPEVAADDSEEVKEGGYGLMGGLRGPKREEADPAKKDGEEKKDDVMSEQDGEEMSDDKEKKDVVTEQDGEEMSDDKEKKDAEPMAEGKLKISFKINETKKLFENNTVLTEADKRQSRVLFESAVRSVAKQVSAQLREAYQARFLQVKKLHEAKVAKQVDQYMSYVVEQWAKDNKVAIQNQMRNRLSDSFIAGLQKLCTEHYIQVPQSKVNVVEALAKNVKTLKTRLKESESRNVKLHEDAKKAVTRERLALRKEHKARLIAEAASAVTPSDRGAFVSRAESVKFVTTKEFKKDLVALREQYFGAKKSVERSTNEPVAAPNFETKKAQTPVDIYTKFADRFTARS